MLLRRVPDDRERLSGAGLAVREDANVVAVDGGLDQVLKGIASTNHGDTSGLATESTFL